MRTPSFAAAMALIATTALSGVLSGGVAHAQRVGQAPEARPGRPALYPGQPRVNLPGPRWGGKVRGRWHGGHYAPGGWAAYQVPVRGWLLPRYWVAPSFFVQDWPVYGLTRPQAGYGWYRYYDDAVLADRDGRVLDYRRGIDWDARDNGRYVRDDRAYDRYRSDVDLPPPPPPPSVARRDDGVGGAVIGGVVGGVAGNVIAGRGNRLGGTVLGAGVGALAGTAIDRAEDRRAPPPPPSVPMQPGYGADYPLPGDEVPVAPDDGYYGEPGYGEPTPGVVFGPMREQVQPIRPRSRGGYVERHVGAPPVARSYTTTTTEGPGGYVADGYYYPPRTVTTVTVESAPVVTTTTEEVVTYTTRRAAPRRVQRSKLLRR